MAEQTEQQLGDIIQNQNKGDDNVSSLSFHTIETEEEVIGLAYELLDSDSGRVYGSIALNYGVRALATSLRERAATMGVVAALVASMIYPTVLQDYSVDDDSEIYVYIALVFWTCSLTGTIIATAVATHHIALLSAFLSTDGDILRFVISHTAYVDSPDYLLAFSFISASLGVVSIFLGLYPLWVSVTCTAIFVIGWALFFVSWRRGFKFFHARSDINKSRHSERKKILTKSD